MEVSDKIEGFSLFLEFDGRPKRPEVISNVERPARLNTGEITYHGHPYHAWRVGKSSSFYKGFGRLVSSRPKSRSPSWPRAVVPRLQDLPRTPCASDRIGYPGSLPFSGGARLAA